ERPPGPVRSPHGRRGRWRARGRRGRDRPEPERSSQRLHGGDIGGDGGGQFSNRGDGFSSHTFGRRGYLFNREARGEVDAEFGGGADRQRLGAGLHHHGQGRIARRIEAQVGSDDGGQRQAHG